ncbi:MAG: hypothetical protein JO202_01070 [Ktedonobacteraceae bacterium]|nr:hypothetical protein [Ktedonobacteraceae bacterium]
MDEQQSQPPAHQNLQPTTPPPSPTHVEGTDRGEQFAKDPMWGKERGRSDTEPSNTPAQRPTGTSTAADSTKLDPQKPKDPDSPTIITP